MARSPSPSSRDRQLLVAFLLSGAAGLGYEILWTRLLGICLGSEILAVFGVLAGFFGGLAIGAVAFQGVVRRTVRPVRLFAILEAIAALYAIASPHLLHALSRWLPPLLGVRAGENDTPIALVVAVATSGIVLLPATACLGGTLVALVEARRRVLSDDAGATGLGRLYGANTVGATIGTFATIYVLLPAAGMVVAAIVLAGVALAGAALALRWAATVPDRDRLARPTAETLDEADEPMPRTGLFVVALGTGLVGVGFEVVGVQVLSQALENTVFTFANILGVYLLGTAVGAWVYGAVAPRLAGERYAAAGAALLVAHAVAVVFAGVVLSRASTLVDHLAPAGSGYATHLVAELAVAALIFAPPTVLMGAMFSHVVGPLTDRSTGYAYGLNTVGAAAAPFVFGVAAIPALRYSDAFYACAFAYVGLLLLWVVVTRSRLLVVGPTLLVVLGLEALAPRLSLVDAPSEWKVLTRDEGLFGAVLVTEKREAEGKGRAQLRRLQVGQRFRMGGQFAFAERRMGHLPFLLADQPRRALFLGTGTGATASAALAYPVKRVDIVELVPEILEALPLFAAINDGLVGDKRVALHAADARRFVAASRQRYDVIVSDLYHPGRDGAAGLYAHEHFVSVGAHLAPGGVFVQWLPLYQCDARTLETVIRTFVAAFDAPFDVHSFLGIYNAHRAILGLVAYAPAPKKPRLAVPLARLSSALSGAAKARRYIQDERDLFASYLLDRAALVRFAGAGPINRDLDPRLLFEAPRVAYEKRDDLARVNLAALLKVRTPVPVGLIGGDAARVRSFRARVARFARAVGLYVHGDIRRLDAMAGGGNATDAVEKYLQAYETEPEFLAARGSLFSLARQSDRAAASIFPRMLARTPAERRIYLPYLQYLSRTGDAAELQRVRRILSAQRSATPTRP